jgi:hypothetical protein
MNAATEKQIAYIESLIRKLRTAPIRNAFGGKKGAEAIARQNESFAAEVEAKLPTMGKNQASAYIGDLIAMSR